MKRILLMAGLTAFVLGCSDAKTHFDPNKKMTEEEKQKVKLEDKAIEDEESHGTAGKAKKRK